MAKAEKKASTKVAAKTAVKASAKVSSKVNAKAGVKEKSKPAVKGKEKPVAKVVKAPVKASPKVVAKNAEVGKDTTKKKSAPVVTVDPVDKSAKIKAEKPSLLRAESSEVKVVKPAKAPKAAPLSVEAKAALKLEKKNKKLRDIVLAGASEDLQKWHDLKAEYDGEVRAYKMSEQYEAKTAIEHKVLGWGFILSSENNRLDVLFEQGRKMLISNYKP